MATEKLKIVEGIAGVWFYHLSENSENCKPALCGNTQVMRTMIPLDQWGATDGNVPSKYCSKCDQIYKERVGHTNK